VDGYRHEVISADGTRIGLLTAGTGPSLLLVHGGAGCIESWQSMWGPLTSRWRVTAMDRRGRASSGDTGPYELSRGSSGDNGPYELSREFADVATVAASLAAGDAGPVDAFGHSYGATCVLGAASLGAPLRRLALYEAPGPSAAPVPWRDRMTAMIEAGQPGRAMMSFLTEVLGLTVAQVAGLRNAPLGYDIRPIVSATLPREARALAGVDLTALASTVTIPVLLILGAASPPWAGEITRELTAALPDSRLVTLPGQGHLAIDAAPGLVAQALIEFFG
jgi:pimeloyl-ACP methyl ester carboxylesterase